MCSDSPSRPTVDFRLCRRLYEQQRYRQALARFNLLAKRFPDFSACKRLRYRQAMCYLKGGQVEKAREIFTAFTREKDQTTRARGLAGLGQIALRRQDYPRALTYLRRAFETSSSFYRNSPEVESLRDLGIVALKTGDEVRGRQSIMHYLNVVGTASDRLDLLLEIAESYHRQGRQQAAQALYSQIDREGEEHQRPVIIARFRIVEFLDDPENILSKWQRRGDLKDKRGDIPYLRLLDLEFSGPLAQDARRALFRRYRARDDFTAAFEVSRTYLRQMKADGAAAREKKAADAMLLYVVEHLLAEEKYREVYRFYRDFHDHVRHYPDGRLLYMVGQALENLYLYDQAAVVYFRALRLPLAEKDKTDLYYRRARVYLAKKDYGAADRLLTYLRKIYDKKSEIGEIAYLSGQLAEATGDLAAAIRYYRQAQQILTFPERRVEYAEQYLAALEADEQPAVMAGTLARYRDEKWLDAARLQQWYLRTGQLFLKKGATGEAADVLALAVASDMPADGVVAQKAHFALADVLIRLDRPEEGRKHLEQAAAGDDAIVKQLAAEKLRQMEIDTSMSRIDLPTQ